MIKCLSLERYSGGKYEVVNFYDTFYSHKVESDDETSSNQRNYVKAGMTRDECIDSYRKQGYSESEGTMV